MNGTPDRYIDFRSDLWIEFKFIRVGVVVKIHEILTPLQKQWLRRRWDAGKNACVIVGHQLAGKTQGVVLESPMEWEAPLAKTEFLALSRSRVALADYITRRVSG